MPAQVAWTVSMNNQHGQSKRTAKSQKVDEAFAATTELRRTFGLFKTYACARVLVATQFTFRTPAY